MSENWIYEHFENLADKAKEYGHTNTYQLAQTVLDLYQEVDDLKEVIDEKDKKIEELKYTIDQYQREEAYGR